MHLKHSALICAQCQLLLRRRPSEHQHMRRVGQEQQLPGAPERDCQRVRKKNLEKLKLKKIFEFEDAKNN